MDATLTSLLDERAIERQIHAYARAMDRCDLGLGKAVFHHDAEVDYGVMFQGKAHALVEHAIASHAHARNHLHRISNVTIEVDGERAGSEAYVDACFRFVSDGALTALTTRGRYIDQWEKRDGRWAVSARHYVHEMDEKHALESELYACAGKRDETDLSYAVLPPAQRLVM